VVLIFETAFAYSFEISLKPTSIEMMENPHYDDENFEDEQIIPGCEIVLTKCLGEMIGLLLYITVCSVCLFVSIDTIGAGKPITCLLELVMCFVLDQIKSIPT
jgi:hypothetical protein